MLAVATAAAAVTFIFPVLLPVGLATLLLLLPLLYIYAKKGFVYLSVLFFPEKEEKFEWVTPMVCLRMRKQRDRFLKNQGVRDQRFMDGLKKLRESILKKKEKSTDVIRLKEKLLDLFQKTKIDAAPQLNKVTFGKKQYYLGIKSPDNPQELIGFRFVWGESLLKKLKETQGYAELLEAYPDKPILKDMCMLHIDPSISDMLDAHARDREEVFKQILEADSLSEKLLNNLEEQYFLERDNTRECLDLTRYLAIHFFWAHLPTN